jgi:DNA-binding NtrC family response regulator
VRDPLAEGQAVLVVDSDEKVQRGLEQLLTAAGLQPTVMGDPQRALDLSNETYFSVALVDLDTPSVGEGVKLIAELHRRSPATTVLMMAARKHFDVAVAAFRAGCADVIVKAPDQVDYLKSKVLDAAAARRLEQDGKRAVSDAAALHEDLVRVLLETFKKSVDLEERVSGASSLPQDEMAVLLVDDDFELQKQLGEALAARGGFRFEAAATGGEALDAAGRTRFQIALIRETLPDLPGSMVVRTIKGQSPDTMVLLYRKPTAGKPGSVDVMDGSRVIPFLPQFTSASQLTDRLDELKAAALATGRERRYFAAFRQQHFDLLKRIAEVKQKLSRVSGR